MPNYWILISLVFAIVVGHFLSIQIWGNDASFLATANGALIACVAYLLYERRRR